MLTAGAGYLILNRKGPPADFHHDGRSLVVTDEQGRELWCKTFHETFHRESTPESMLATKRAWFGDLDGDGSPELLVGGISNGYGAAALLVLDPEDLGGASHEENLDYQLQGFPPGREKARLLFPRTCINRKFDPYGVPGFVGLQGDSVRVQVAERTNVPYDTTVHYLFDRKLVLKQVVVSDGFKIQHRELEAAGQLDHLLTDKEIAELRNIRYLKRLAP